MMGKDSQGSIAALGFDERFVVTDEDTREGCVTARVTSVHRNRYTVHDGRNILDAKIAGKRMTWARSAFDYPVVGDWVRVSLHDDDTFATIHSVFERASVLKRKTPDKQIDVQLIAANIDTALVVQACDDNFNLSRLERYLVMVNESDIRPVVLLSKSDLMAAEDIEQRVAEIHAIMPDIAVHVFSSKTGDGLQGVRDVLVPQKTYCLLGASGVGKTTLLNELQDEQVFVTKEVREQDGKGRHATTFRNLIQLENGALIIDTPGMRELGSFATEQGLDETFPDIIALGLECKFNDCTHSHEKGCAVLSAVADGTLPEKRHRNFLKMTKEAAFNAMSYLDKRRKDRQFGKMCKSVMQHKKKRG